MVAVRPPAVLPPAVASGLAQRHLASLDGIRALAAFLVVFYHFGLPSPGGLGVLAFFVLSGFLITWLLLKEHDNSGSVSLKAFYLRRSLRIFPAFYCYWLVVTGATLILGRTPEWPQAISALFYVSNYYQALQGDPGTVLSHAWSLGIEEQFYLLWPGVFLFLRGRKMLFHATSVIVLAIWAYRLTLVACQVSQGYIYYALDTRLDHLMIGCWLAAGLHGGQLRHVSRMLCASPWLPLAPLLCLAGSARLDLLWPSVYRDTAGFIADPICVAALIVQWIAFRDHVVWGFVNWGWMRYLGRISYSIYLYQQAAMGPAKRLFAPAPMMVQLVAAATSVILCASASYFLVEQPFLRLKQRFEIVKTE
ncbi:MAG: acyltransferase [Bryobacterales bacterium]|nr:acyltransferase [Bryobacterales bacterium]